MFAFTTILGAVIYILIYRLYLKEIIDERDELEKKKVPAINYQSTMPANLSVNVEKQTTNGIDYNQNSLNNNLNHKPDEKIVYRSGKDNLAFRMD